MNCIKESQNKILKRCHEYGIRTFEGAENNIPDENRQKFITVFNSIENC